MKKSKLYLIIIMITSSVICMGGYPTNFSYVKYLTPAKDQLSMGPCYSFATIAGIEALYSMYYGGNANDFSERALYNTAGGGMNAALETARTKGVIKETCSEFTKYPKLEDIIEDTKKRYPGINITCSVLMPICLEYILKDNYDWLGDQIKCEPRVRIGYKKITPVTMVIDSIKKKLLQYGPIIVGTDILTDTDHGMLLYGWEGDNFLFKDSYPCAANIRRKEPISKFLSFEMYAITSVKREYYDDLMSEWYSAPPILNAFTLKYNDVAEAFPMSCPIELIYPSCFNLGTYGVKNLDIIPGAEIYSWSVNKTSVNINVSSNKKTCTLSGYGTDVILTVIVKRVNGLLEKFEFNIGTVGISNTITVDKISAYCAGSNYEITTKISHPSVPGATYSYTYNIPPLHNYSYVIKNGRYAYWVFKAPETLNYSATVTYSKPGCSSVNKTVNTYVYSLPCDGYYKSAQEEISENVNNDENKTFFYPNPASNKIIVNCIGEGINNLNIYDITGSLVYSSKIENTAEIDLSRFSKGMYLIECFVYNGEFLYQKEKLIIE